MALRLRVEPYDPDAIDADNDGIVQEGTAWERPAGTRLLDEIGNEIQRGFTSSARPRLRVIGADGVDIDYKPSYGTVTPAKRQGKLSQLGRLGFPSLSERGLSTGAPSLEQLGYLTIESKSRTIGSLFDAPEGVAPDEGVEDFESVIRSLVLRVPQDQVIPKRINRNRALNRAEDKARELAFTSGEHYLIESGRDFFVLSQRDYDELVTRVGGIGNLPDGVEVTRYGKPRAEFAGAEEAKAGLIGPTRITSIDDAKYRDAVANIHFGNGSLDDVDSDIFTAAILDESISGEDGLPMLNPQGTEMTFEDIMTGNFGSGTAFGSPITDGTVFENRRFKFKALKGNHGDGYGGLWTVFKAEDKETGEIWYIKTSTYGVNDALLENIGMEASSVLDLAAQNNSRQIRTGVLVPVVDYLNTPDWSGNSGRSVRWTAMRSIESWDMNVPLQTQMDDAGDVVYWLDSADVSEGLDGSLVNVGDLAQVLALDYIFDNLDRHGGNFKVAYDQNGDQRLGVIDNGLMFGGRGYDLMHIGHDEQLTPDEIAELAQNRAGIPVEQYAEGNDGNVLFSSLDDAVRDRLTNNPDELLQFTDAQENAIMSIKAKLNEILSVDRLNRQGIQLTPTEQAHLDAIREVAMTRIKYLQDNPRAIAEAIAGGPIPEPWDGSF